MECPRCNGLMIIQNLIPSSIDFDTWKCLNCGNVIAKKEKTLETDNITLFYYQQKNEKK